MISYKSLFYNTYLTNPLIRPYIITVRDRNPLCGINALNYGRFSKPFNDWFKGFHGRNEKSPGLEPGLDHPETDSAQRQTGASFFFSSLMSSKTSLSFSGSGGLVDSPMATIRVSVGIVKVLAVGVPV